MPSFEKFGLHLIPLSGHTDRGVFVWTNTLVAIAAGFLLVPVADHHPLLTSFEIIVIVLNWLKRQSKRLF